MDERYSSGDYLEQNPDWHAADSPWKARQIASILSRNSIEPATVCEVGCGAGGVLTSLSSLLQDTVTYEGFDVSPHAYSLSKAKSTDRISFHQGDFFEIAPHDFDLLLVIDVVEHVEDYFAFLRRLRSRAHHKIFHVPLELTWHRVLRGKPLMATRRQYGHIHYFNKDIFLAVLADVGYQVTDYMYTPLSTSNEVNTNRLWLTRLTNVARRCCFNYFPDLTARLFGGYSLLVLAR